MNWEYIAGFFDGEGYCKKQGRYTVIQITQQHKEVLEEIQQFLGYGHIYRKDNKLKYKGFDLRIFKRKDCIDFITKIKPFSIVKKEELNKIENSIINDMRERIQKTLGKNFDLKYIKERLE